MVSFCEGVLNLWFLEGERRHGLSAHKFILEISLLVSSYKCLVQRVGDINLFLCYVCNIVQGKAVLCCSISAISWHC